MKAGEKSIVFFDFDNTITPFDVLDSVIAKFGEAGEWEVFEDAWKEGIIGSRECLTGQLRSVRVTEPELVKFLKTIPVDPAFPRILRLLRRKAVPVMILSDSFSFLIRTILGHHGITGIPVRANEVRFEGDRMIPSFPYVSADCARCAHCKKRHVLEHSGWKTYYAGDGLSDVCPSLHCDQVFAKGSLQKYLEDKGKSYIPFSTLEEVLAFFEPEARPVPSGKDAVYA